MRIEDLLKGLIGVKKGQKQGKMVVFEITEYDIDDFLKLEEGSIKKPEKDSIKRQLNLYGGEKKQGNDCYIIKFETASKPEEGFTLGGFEIKNPERITPPRKRKTAREKKAPLASSHVLQLSKEGGADEKPQDGHSLGLGVGGSKRECPTVTPAGDDGSAKRGRSLALPDIAAPALAVSSPVKLINIIKPKSYTFFAAAGMVEGPYDMNTSGLGVSLCFAVLPDIQDPGDGDMLRKTPPVTEFNLHGDVMGPEGTGLTGFDIDIDARGVQW